MTQELVTRLKNGTIIFDDYPNFRPNLTPYEIFEMGSFGGTYWRPIYSSVTNNNYKNVHYSQFEEGYWNNIPEHYLSGQKYNKKLNKYNVEVGSSLEDWEEKNWITKYDPYGWIQWYCHFYNGRRLKNKSEDLRQINRWRSLAGEKRGRFRKWLITLILKKKGNWNDFNISPKIRQTLQHWGYKLTKDDFEIEVSNRNK